MNIALHTIPCSVTPTERLRRALACFGLAVRHQEPPAPTPLASDMDRLLGLRDGAVALISGASGAGKTTLLRSLTDALDRSGAVVLDANALLERTPSDVPLPDLLPTGREASLRTLARAGLADAPLWARTCGELSAGQRARLGIALAMSHAEAAGVPGRETWIVIDEFCSALDRPTAHAVARSLRRWTLAARLARMVCATSHDDLDDQLAPDVRVPVRRAAA